LQQVNIVQTEHTYAFVHAQPTGSAKFFCTLAVANATISTREQTNWRIGQIGNNDAVERVLHWHHVNVIASA
jgi:hypothetical protein